MKAIRVLLELSQKDGYGTFKEVSDIFRLNYRTVKNAHDLLLDMHLITRNELGKWVFAPFGYIHFSELETVIMRSKTNLRGRE